MAVETGTESQPIPAAEATLLAGTERRINRAMWTLGAVGTILCWLWQGGEWGAGFAIGAVVSALNFHWMKTATHALVDAATAAAAPSPAGPASLPAATSGPANSASEQTAPPTAHPRRIRGVWVRFVLRYALIGVAGYAIFKSSLVSLGAFFLGLFLFIAAILAEIAYQIYCEFRSE